MGLGMIPGVSAGTMAVLVGIYDDLIDAIASMRKHFKESWRTLFPMLTGLVLSSVAVLVAVHFGYNYAPFVISCLFAGLILGSYPLVTKELKNEKISAKGLCLVAAGFIVATGIGVLSYVSVKYWNFDLNSYFLAGTYWWVYVVVLVAGFISAVACVIPGISGAMILYIFRALYADCVHRYLRDRLFGQCRQFDVQRYQPPRQWVWLPHLLRCRNFGWIGGCGQSDEKTFGEQTRSYFPSCSWLHYWLRRFNVHQSEHL